MLYISLQVREARNAIMHTSDMKLAELDMRDYCQSMIDLLSDTSISSSPRAYQAVEAIQKVGYQMQSCYPSLKQY